MTTLSLRKNSGRGPLLAATFAMAASTLLFPGAGSAFDAEPIRQQVAALEVKHDARIGVAVLDKETGQSFEHRGQERFPINSTFKAFACGALLARADRGAVDLTEQRPVQESDLLSWSPVTEKKVGDPSMTLRDHCKAMLEWSDNTSANIVLDAVGGPEALTQALRDLGDTTTRIDHYEPEVNDRADGDLRDTTTPVAALHSLMAYIDGDVLSESTRATYVHWLKTCKVTGSLLRIHLPAGWEIADRSGADPTRTRSIVSAIWAPDDAPVYVAVYTDHAQTTELALRNQLIADLGQTLFSSLMH